MNNLASASKQWAKRPLEERYENITEMYQATKDFYNHSKTVIVKNSQLRVEAESDELYLTSLGGEIEPTKLSHKAFSHLAYKADCPASYLRKLPATLAQQNLNHGMKRHLEENSSNLLFYTGEEVKDNLIRAMLSDKYERIWNYEIVEKLVPLFEQGWKTPPAMAVSDDPRQRPATEEDILKCNEYGSGVQIQVGDMISPAGLYASNDDMFVFMINEDNPIDDGTDGGLYKGVIVSNSEVGEGCFVLQGFNYRSVCGNHIVWGIRNLNEVRIRHLGSRTRVNAFYGLQAELRSYVESGVGDIERQIKEAKKFNLGTTKEEVLDVLFGKKASTRGRINIGVSRIKLEEAYKTTEKHEDTDGSPRSLWGMAQGLTRVSQNEHYTERRMNLDKEAGKLLSLVN